jgi:trk system potassium uptake protein TrkA
MKYIIIGLGNFGAALSIKLTEMGNEVIGVDNHMGKVEALKDKITHSVCMDCTDMHAVSSLPLKDTDVVIVGIGENLEANIMATAVLKQLNVKRLISRAISPLQTTVLEAMGVEEIIHPEEETAERWAKKLTMRGIIDSFVIGTEYSIVEIEVPKMYIGKTLEEINFRSRHNMVVLTTIKVTEETNLIGKASKVNMVQGVASPKTILGKGDIMVIYGNNKDIKALLEQSR